MRIAALSLTLLIFSASAKAAEPLLVPVEGYAFNNTPMLVPQPDVPADHGAILPPTAVAPAPVGQVVPLYPNVRVKTPGRKYPCAVTQVVAVPSPCRGDCNPVFVEICVPPGIEPCVTVGPRGQRVTYSFPSVGHRVQVTSLRGKVTVDYDRR